MIPISTRYVLPLIGVLLGAVAVGFHYSHIDAEFDDCSNPQRLYEISSIAGALPELERWDTHDELRLQMSQGTLPIAIAGVKPLSLSVRRNRDPKRLYRSPRGFISELGFVDWSAVERLPSASGVVPVNVAYSHTARQIQLGLHLFIFDGKPVANMLREQMLGAPSHLLTGGPPLTLVTISGSVHPQNFDAVNDLAKRWLVSAWEFYDEVCSP